jgi:hypothetical protein
MKLSISAIIMLLIVIYSFATYGDEISPQKFNEKYYKTLFIIHEPFIMYQLVVSESFFYLCDLKYCKINIYSLKEGKKIKSFGQRGEGPGDFNYIFDVQCSKDEIYICSNKKLSVFTLKGDLIKEIKDNSANIYRTFIPIKDNFVSWRNDFSKLENGKLSIVYTLLNKELIRKKDIFQIYYDNIKPKDKSKTGLLLFQPCRKGIVYKDRFYIGCTDLGLYIGVFDNNGNELYEIKKDFEKIKVTEYIKRRINDLYKLILGDSYKNFMSSREIISPEFIPAFINFFVDNEKIYLFKFPKPGSNGMLEVLLLDIKGNILNQKMLPLGAMYKHLEEKKNISFYKGKLYILTVDNEENSVLSEMDLEAIFND